VEENVEEEKEGSERRRSHAVSHPAGWQGASLELRQAEAGLRKIAGQV